MKINEYLDECKKILDTKADSKLAEELGVTRAAVSLWRKGESGPNEYSCFQIAEILGLEETKVISDVRSQVEKDDFKREFWEEKVKEYGFVDSSMLLAIIATFVILNPFTYQFVSTFFNSTIIVIMRIRRDLKSTSIRVTLLTITLPASIIKLIIKTITSMKLSSHLWKNNVSKDKLKSVLCVSDRTLRRWQNSPPEWVLNVIFEVSNNRMIPKVISWNDFKFDNDKLVLPNGDYLTAEDIHLLRYEQSNRTNMRDNPENILMLKDHLEQKLKELNSEIVIQLRNDEQCVKEVRFVL